MDFLTLLAEEPANLWAFLPMAAAVFWRGRGIRVRVGTRSGNAPGTAEVAAAESEALEGFPDKKELLEIYRQELREHFRQLREDASSPEEG